jgi:hypothetical protein
MMAQDELDWPGGVMCGFTLWISQQKQRFLKAHPECFIDNWAIHDHNAWTTWLQEAAKLPTECACVPIA